MKKAENHSHSTSGHCTEGDLVNPNATMYQPAPARLSIEGDRDEQSVPVYDFEVLSDGQRIVKIRLGGEVYSLRRTQGGKLLLNK
jgi:hemin uptake protein HemP